VNWNLKVSSVSGATTLSWFSAGPFEVELPFLDLTEIDEELRVNPA
jgi:hypothetical protein